MIVAVLGATGRTGRELVAELVRRGHQLRLLVRDPGKLPADLRDGDVVVGDSRDPGVIARLVAAIDGVLGAGPEQQGAGAALRHGPPTGPRHGPSRRPAVHWGQRRRDRRPWRQEVHFGHAHLEDEAALRRRMVKDKPVEHALFADSDLDWTLARPPRLADGAAIGRLEHDSHRSTRFARADLAAFLVNCLEGDLYLRQAPCVASAR